MLLLLGCRLLATGAGPAIGNFGPRASQTGLARSPEPEARNPGRPRRLPRPRGRVQTGRPPPLMVTVAFTPAPRLPFVTHESWSHLRRGPWRRHPRQLLHEIECGR